MIYTSENHDVTITANVSRRGMEALARLGFRADFEIEADKRRAAKRANLDKFLETRRASESQDEETEEPAALVPSDLFNQ